MGLIHARVWMSVVSVVCCQVEVSATSWSLVRRSPIECGMSECDREAPTLRRPWPTGGSWPWKESSSNHRNVVGLATKLRVGRSTVRIPVDEIFFFVEDIPLF
jgi:hypothetical protein